MTFVTRYAIVIEMTARKARSILKEGLAKVPVATGIARKTLMRRRFIVLAVIMPLLAGLVTACGSQKDSLYDQPVQEMNKLYLTNGTFDCPVNNGKPRGTNGEVDQLIPCWNRSLHITVDEQGNSRLGEHTNVDASVARATLGDDLKTSKNQWTFYRLQDEDHYSFTFVKPTDMPKDEPVLFEIYYRTNDGAWNATGNFTEYRVKPGVRVEAVYAFKDPKGPETLAAMPFKWKDAPKLHSLLHFPQK